MHRVRCFLVLVMATALGGCGTILNGKRQMILVTSAPDGAHVEGAPAIGAFITPTFLELRRGNSYTLTVSREGYSSASTTIRSHTRAGIVVLDLLLTGLVGFSIDAGTGAWNALSPDAVALTLTRAEGVPGPDSITVNVRSWKRGLRVESSQAGVVGFLRSN